MIKRLLLIAIMLLIGAAVNIAVAWGWAAWGVPPHMTLGKFAMSNEGSPFWYMHEQGGAGAAVARVAPIYLSVKDAFAYQALGRRMNVNQRVMARFPDPPDAADRSWRYEFDERGWPLRCLRSEHRYQALDRPSKTGEVIAEVTVTDGMQLWPEQTRRGGWALQRVRALPLRPMPGGFIANTLLYAAIAAICLVGYPAMIRTLGMRRTAKRAVLAAIAAPFLVVAVAWLAALNNDLAFEMSQVHSADRPAGGQGVGRPLTMDRQDRWGGTRLVFSPGGPTRESDQLPAPPIDGALPTWGQTIRRQAAEREWQHFEWFSAEALGWPARALGSSFGSKVTESLNMAVTVEHGIQIDDVPAGMDVGIANDLRLLPVQIIWPGFLLNWALYAFVLFGLLALPGALKRGLRFRRGRCPDCGYDLRGEFTAGCPECGWGRTPNAGATMA